MKMKYLLFLAICIFSISSHLIAQKSEGYVFTIENEVKVTPVKSQGRSGTCWAFSTTSFIEAEILRTTGKEYDLSEMFFVYYTYLNKAQQYVRFHGKVNFSEGGQAHDVFDILRNYGMVTEMDYSGRPAVSAIHNHTNLVADLEKYVEKVAANEDKIPSDWIREVDSILQYELGKLPEMCTVNSVTMNPVEFLNSTKIKPDDYVEISSFSHHPIYSQFVLEVPDNWALRKYYNLPFDDMIAVMDHALKNGYTLVWDGDVSEPTVSTFLGIAVMPDIDWSITDPAISKEIMSGPYPEIIVSQELRQQAFDNYVTTDDHLMHITGLAHDQKGTKYYLVKNSGGDKSSPYGGYLYMSEAYIKMKTIAIALHKDAIPKDIAVKMGL